ncbi:MAG: hypothetical protein KGZ68_16935 [Dechloromonas sp.]|nr:hypothetical protein [Dechloromonas sp.]
MSKTPEGRVKDAVKLFLHEQGLIRAASRRDTWPETVRGWYYMPVQNGMGVSGIHDFVGCMEGRMFTIETKAPGKLSGVTENQKDRGYEMQLGGGQPFYVDSADKLREQWSEWLARWLSANT